MARFQREAEVLASLDHPNIGHIYGIVDSEDSRGLVLALIEGPTLADRIQAGPIPLDEAVAISKQIIEALEYAHDRGVVHRDLKPANIKITPEGVVKVLDFGLAKVLEDEPPPSSLGELAHADAGAHARGRDPGHGGVHVAGASRGPAGGPAQRYLLLRRGAV